MGISSCVYWIHHPDHTDMFTEGYIGVSNNFNKRMYQHRRDAKLNIHTNNHLHLAIKKYGWKNLKAKTVIIGHDNYCYEIEKKLRADLSIGWNINIGGDKPPVSKYRGESYVSPLRGKQRPTPWMLGRVAVNKGFAASDETRKKMSIAHKGSKNTPDHLVKRMESRHLTRIARGQIRPIIVNGVQYESAKIASKHVEIPESTLKFWAYKKGMPSKKYAHVIECRWVQNA